MYGSVAEFKTYHEARGRTVPVSWTDDYISAAVLVGSEWVDNKYEDRFIGYRTGGEINQERSWPRTSAYTNSDPVYVFTTAEIPQRVVNAAYEAAWREANTQGSLYTDFTPSKYNSVAVEGAIAVEYNNNLDVNDAQVQIQIIESLLEPLFDIHLFSSSGLSGASSRT